MKNKDLLWVSLTKLFSPNVVSESMVSLGNSIELPALIRRLGFRLLAASFPRRVNFTSRLSFLYNFPKYLFTMVRHHGSEYTVNYLKSCQLAVQKAMAGQPVKSLRKISPDRPLPRMASCGLPSIIPLGDRKMILAGIPSVCRWWLTIFSIYRVIKLPAHAMKLKTSTITDPYTGSVEKLREVSGAIPIIMGRAFLATCRFRPTDAGSLLFLETSSSTHSPSWLGIISDLACLQDKGLYRHLRVCAEKLFHPNGLLLGMEVVTNYISAMRLVGRNMVDNRKDRVKSDASIETSYVGQLSLKEEAAGKVRVFAMVDVWTQSILKPMHDHLFSILKRIPNDGTFDQRAAVRRCFAKAAQFNCSFGYDLSAATDRLPIDLQVEVVSFLFGREFALAWKSLLVDREYILFSDGKRGLVKEDKVLKYSVGQPMGALSSWAMLALTHHLIVQLAYWKTPGLKTNEWFEGYELLGDDIVIFDKAVADNYLILCDQLGVSINLGKSVIAEKKPMFEFAKVTGLNGVDVSAISWKMFISQNTLMGRANIVYSLLGREIVKGQPFQWMKNIVKFGQYKEGAFNYTLFAILTMFANSGKISLAELLQSVIDKAQPTRRYFKTLLVNCRVDYIKTIIGRIVKGTDPQVDKTLAIREIWNVDEPWAKLAVWRPLQAWYARYEMRQSTVDKDATEMVNKMLAIIAPSVPDSARCFPSVTMGAQGPIWDSENALYLFLYLAVKSKLEDKMKKFEGWDRKAMDWSLERLVNLQDVKDRYLELLSLVDRAEAKLAKKPAEVPVRDSPLAVLKFIRKMGSKRPKWTLFNKAKHTFVRDSEFKGAPIGASGKPVFSKVDMSKPVRYTDLPRRASTGSWILGLCQVWLWYYVVKSVILQFGKIPEEIVDQSREWPVVLGGLSDPLSLVGYLEVSEKQSYENWWLGIGVVIALVAAIAWIWCTYSSPPPPEYRGPEIDLLDPLIMYTHKVAGPFSPEGLKRVEDFLAVQALEDNLALSPIGALWDAEWGEALAASMASVS